MRHDPLVDFSKSPHAAVRPVPLSAVTLTGGFWGRRESLNRDVGIPHGRRMLEDTGSFEAFDIAAGTSHAPLRGFVYRDSDVYKWLEAAGFAGVDAEDIIAKVARAQGEDGYVNTSFANENAHKRFSNLASDHEIYCAGHLMQAAVAHHRTTGETSLLDTATKFANYLYEQFGPDGTVGACGHPEAEMALIELYRVTGDDNYLTLAHRFIEARGRGVLSGREYVQDHLPFLDQHEAVGHAVRALYLYVGAADYYLESGDQRYLSTLNKLWDDVQKKTYITGGIGARHEGEAFGEAFELPNARAYAETCAAIASMMWNWRLFAISADPKYLDTIERAMYNGFLSGMSEDGKSYFYVNPLASNGNHVRKEWYDCACCPPNIYRTLASIRGMLFATDDKGIYCNFYDNCRIDDGNYSLEMITDYPASGSIRIVNHVDSHYELVLRIPSWVERATVRYNGMEQAAQPGRFFRVRKQWLHGDRVDLELEMKPARIFANPRITDSRDCVALTRGLLVYCIETADNSGIPIADLAIDPRAPIQEDSSAEAPRLQFEGLIGQPGESLYSAESPATASARPTVTAIPYFAWANREPGEMKVWLPVAEP
ncbi:MAG: glycoside hydrolase family 127 protein [Armatimonadetes bacterium]|nr:glycoside hydrolase family 127 protein [Armatimonadota bacterium]